tara:strand:- start:36 stop:1148 length:1113 start_codon:yes stop_codon:yes gene_type:complete
MHLSDVFKFTQGLGQKGHQIGRKVGDAIELVTLGMINREPFLPKHLQIEDGIEGATTAKHKVEFAFYQLSDDKPSKTSEDLFGIIECKKVGVEQTVKQNFKKWRERTESKGNFYETNGYSFIISPSQTAFKWAISIKSAESDTYNLSVTVDKVISDQDTEESCFNFECTLGSQILVAVDINNAIHILGPDEILSTITHSIRKCIVIQIESVHNRKVRKIHVNESLPGPQTPEKAKQASFVSLDVRKKVLGRFDKTEDQSFISILVIGEGSHWEPKSRSMVRLCNDFNVIVPDKVLVRLFKKFEEEFGDNYQKMITKTRYSNSPRVRELIKELISEFECKVLFEMGTQDYMEFEHYLSPNGKSCLRLKEVN